MARAKIEISQSNASFRTSWNTQKFNKWGADKRHTEMNKKVIKKKYKKISTYNKYFRKNAFYQFFRDKFMISLEPNNGHDDSEANKKQFRSVNYLQSKGQPGAVR